jgi:hypothetical protein
MFRAALRHRLLGAASGRLPDVGVAVTLPRTSGANPREEAMVLAWCWGDGWLRASAHALDAPARAHREGSWASLTRASARQHVTDWPARRKQTGSAVVRAAAAQEQLAGAAQTRQAGKGGSRGAGCGQCCLPCWAVSCISGVTPAARTRRGCGHTLACSQLRQPWGSS